MKIIVCGGGEVGRNIAGYLSLENNDVTVIDQSNEILDSLNEKYDVRTVLGKASHPEILEAAGAWDAEMVIASTSSDEVNMMACQICHTIFNVPKKIARIRQQEYLDPLWANLFSRDHMPIDVIISPEREVARSIVRRITVPGAFNLISVADDKARVVGVICQENCPIIHTPIKDIARLFPHLNLTIMAIIRGDTVVPLRPEEQLMPQDEVYFAVETAQLSRAMDVFGHTEPDIHNVLIMGGGKVGFYLAEWLEENRSDIRAKIIEVNQERAEIIAHALKKTLVINGDALDNAILEEVEIQNTEAIVAVTNDDEANILGSLLAKKQGCKRSITLINKPNYSSLLVSLGMDAVVNPYAITVSTIMQHVRRGRIRQLHTLRNGFAEVIDAEALDSSSIVHIAVEDLKLPEGVIIGMIKRGDEILLPVPGTIIKPNDRVILLAEKGQAKKVERLFAVRSDYF